MEYDLVAEKLGPNGWELAQPMLADRECDPCGLELYPASIPEQAGILSTEDLGIAALLVGHDVVVPTWLGAKLKHWGGPIRSKRATLSELSIGLRGYLLELDIVALRCLSARDFLKFDCGQWNELTPAGITLMQRVVGRIGRPEKLRLIAWVWYP